MSDELKSAFDLAMEKLKGKQEFEVAELTAEQRQQIDELRKVYRARQAEIEIHLQGKLANAGAIGDHDAAQQASDNFARDRDRLQRELERKVERIRKNEPPS
ncbi:MAG: hypothetical protein ACR2L2_10010 [Acidobacteriota bacterium]